VKTICYTVDCNYDAAEGQAHTRLRSALQSLQSSRMGGGGGEGGRAQRHCCHLSQTVHHRIKCAFMRRGHRSQSKNFSHKMAQTESWPPPHFNGANYGKFLEANAAEAADALIA
jgi:hypothetical protein